MTPEETLVGQQIGRYRIEEHIAQGSRSDVYLAYDVEQNYQVALKVLFGTFAPDSDLVKDYRWAMKVAAQLNHPGMGKIVSLGFTPTNQIYLVTEYFPAGSLEEKLASLKEKGIVAAPLYALKLVRQLAEALMAALRAGTVHEHLRPGCIMLRADGAPVLFGFDTPSLSAPRPEPVGAPGAELDYFSPEQVAGKVLDARSNIYTLGVILYELLAGRRPERIHADPDANSGRQRGNAFVPLEEMRPGLSGQSYDVVQTCLQERSADRFQTMAELIQAVDKALKAESSAREGLSAITWPSLTRLRTRTRSISQPGSPARRWLPAAGALLLLLLCSAALLLLSRLAATTAPEAAVTEEPGGSSQPVETTTLPTAAVEVLPTATTALLATPTLIPAILTATVTTPDTLAPTATLSAGAAPTTTGPPITAGGNVNAVRLPAPPTIDGDLAKWAGVSPAASAFPVFTAPGWDGTADLTAAWRLAWDTTNLYVAVAVTDDTHVQTQTGSQLFRGDGVEMQFDSDRPGDFGPGLSADDFQIALSPGDFAALPPSAFRFQGSDGGSFLNAPGGTNVTVAAQQTGQGYNLEAAIPWSELALTPTPGLALGLALNANDNDTPGTAVQEVMMSHVSGRTLTDPTTWGTLTLQ
jgi:serine/threonine protein kinase